MPTKYNLNLNHSTIDLSSSDFQEKINKIKNVPVPNFAKYIPNLANLKKLREKHKDKKNIIVEGNGGAISNFRGIFSALGNSSDKNVYLLDTEDPDYIRELKNKCPQKNTLVILTSKSGTRIQVLANYLALKDYPMLIITEDNDGALNQIRKAKNLDVSFYPKVEITDRYTGITESALTAAEIVGIDTEKIVRGGQDMYALCDINRGFHSSNSPIEEGKGCTNKTDIKNNPTLQFALTLDKLEKLEYTELFLSIYSKRLAGFFELIVQLFHEGVCKNRLGQTIYGGEAPENQHHTLQRFISGRKNSVGLFLTVKNFSNSKQTVQKLKNPKSLSFPSRIKVRDKLQRESSKQAKFSSSGFPIVVGNDSSCTVYLDSSILKVKENLKNIKCRNITLENLNNLPLENIIKAEFEGTWQDVIDNKIPAINFEIENISPYTIGGFMAFFQYAAFYSALLRGVNPCNQPGVEKSKENIFRILKENCD